MARVHGYGTRGSVSDYHISEAATTSLKRSSFGSTAKREWNSLPGHLKTLGTVNLFKIKLRKFMVEQY